MPDKCPLCGGPLITSSQGTMLGMPELCRECEDKKQVVYMLAMLPKDADDPERDRLSDCENIFLDSVRKKFRHNSALSEKQRGRLEEIYLKLR